MAAIMAKEIVLHSLFARNLPLGCSEKITMPGLDLREVGRNYFVIEASSAHLPEVLASGQHSYFFGTALLKGDSLWLATAVKHLVANAVHYTDKYGIITLLPTP